MKNKKQIIDIDVEFDDVEFDETYINRCQSAFAKKGNQQFSQTMKSVAAERDSNYYQALQQGISQRDNTYQAECNARPETRAKISASLSSYEKTPEHNAKVAAKNRERSKPVSVPWGVFASGKLAGDAYNELHGVTNGKNRVSNNIKKGTPGYKFISQKEYTKLTGKQI